MRASFAFLSILLLMSGCGGTGSAPGVKISLKYRADAMPQAAEDAAKECAAHGKTAKQRDPDAADGSTSVIFDCE
jgi:hypothetical protein